MHLKSYFAWSLFVFIVLVVSGCGGPLPSSQNQDTSELSDREGTAPMPSFNEEETIVENDELATGDEWVDATGSDNFTLDDDVYGQEDPLGSVI